MQKVEQPNPRDGPSEVTKDTIINRMQSLCENVGDAIGRKWIMQEFRVDDTAEDRIDTVTLPDGSVEIDTSDPENVKRANSFLERCKEKLGDSGWFLFSWIIRIGGLVGGWELFKNTIL